MNKEKRYRRVKNVNSCPNPLFLKWLTQWRDEALEKGWKTHHTYSKAIRSLSKYPFVLSSGKEAKIIEYFGDKICKMIDQKLQQHESSNSASSQSISSQSGVTYIDEILGEGNSNKKSKKSQSRRYSVAGYSPAPRTGPYALLIALLKRQKAGVTCMKKQELIDAAQPLCENSFSVPLPGSHYTAWSSMGALIKRKLVIKERCPAVYSLTDDGVDLAEALDNADNLSAPSYTSNDSSSNDVVLTSTDGAEIPIKNNNFTKILSKATHDGQELPNASDEVYFNVNKITDDVQHLQSSLTKESKSTFRAENDIVYLKSGSYEIILIVDVSETNNSLGTGPKNSKSALIPELRRNGVNFEVRKLNVGDFAWIAKEKIMPTPGCLQVPHAKELVLDFIVERKRMDDLASSIKDGRFREQKFRLMKSGLNRPIYLVENYSSSVGLPESTLQQAITNTQVINNFTIRYVNDSKESVAYLTVLTRHLMALYKDKSLHKHSGKDSRFTGNQPNCHLITFGDFNDASIKNKQMSVTGMFLKALMKVGGMSSDKAVAIISKYPTPSHLLDGYSSSDTDKERELLLAKIKYGQSKRNIGPAISRIIYMLYCSAQPWP